MRSSRRSSERAKNLRVGDPEDPQTHVGAITLPEQLEKIKAYCEIGARKARNRCFGGARPTLDEAFAGGTFWSPTAYEADASHRVAREEIFGPVATFVRFETEAEAIALANDSATTDYRRACGRKDIGRANRVARAIRAGTVAINTPYAVFPGVPFGGYKQSGYGRELGMETMRAVQRNQERAHVHR